MSPTTSSPRISRHASLRRFNSFGVEGTAEELVFADTSSKLVDALDCSIPITILGGGTNVILRRLLRGRAIKVQIREVSYSRIDASRFRVKVGAGESWHEFVKDTIGRGIRGLENLALIPGLVGAAPFQNISAYGRELSSLLESVDVIDRTTGESQTLKGDACGFRYRDSIFKSESRDRYVITHVNFVLGDKTLYYGYKDIQEYLEQWTPHAINSRSIAEAVVRVRRRKLPDFRKFGNAGSIFKNPMLTPSQYDALRGKMPIQGFCIDGCYRVPAARIIDECGWKGKLLGRVGVWHRQPLVLFNHDQATGQDVLRTADRIAADVHSRYDVELELEPTVLGEDE